MLREENVRLRPLEFNDLSILNKWKNDEDIYKYLGGGYSPVSIDEQKDWISTLIKITNENKRFIILSNEIPIGMCGLYNISSINRNCELGIFIGEKSAQGLGNGKRTIKILEKFGKNYLNLKKIKIKVVVTNSSALNMWLSLNYKPVGKLMEERYIDGKYHDVSILEKFF